MFFFTSCYLFSFIGLPVNLYALGQCYSVYTKSIVHHIRTELVECMYMFLNVYMIFEMFHLNLIYVQCNSSTNIYLGTTEKIFETKTSLYDVYVDNQVITAHTPVLQDLLKLSDADRDKYNKLLNQRSANLPLPNI